MQTTSKSNEFEVYSSVMKANFTNFCPWVSYINDDKIFPGFTLVFDWQYNSIYTELKDTNVGLMQSFNHALHVRFYHGNKAIIFLNGTITGNEESGGFINYFDSEDADEMEKDDILSVEINNPYELVEILKLLDALREGYFEDLIDEIPYSTEIGIASFDDLFYPPMIYNPALSEVCIPLINVDPAFDFKDKENLDKLFISALENKGNHVIPQPGDFISVTNIYFFGFPQTFQAFQNAPDNSYNLFYFILRPKETTSYTYLCDFLKHTNEGFDFLFNLPENNFASSVKLLRGKQRDQLLHCLYKKQKRMALRQMFEQVMHQRRSQFSELEWMERLKEALALIK